MGAFTEEHIFLIRAIPRGSGDAATRSRLAQEFSLSKQVAATNRNFLPLLGFLPSRRYLLCFYKSVGTYTLEKFLMREDVDTPTRHHIASAIALAVQELHERRGAFLMALNPRSIFINEHPDGMPEPHVALWDLSDTLLEVPIPPVHFIDWRYAGPPARVDTYEEASEASGSSHDDAEPDRFLDPSSDVFALGALAHFLFAQEELFVDNATALAAFSSGEPPRLSPRLASEALAAFIRECTAYRARERPDVAEAVPRLLRILAEAPVAPADAHDDQPLEAAHDAVSAPDAPDAPPPPAKPEPPQEGGEPPRSTEKAAADEPSAIKELPADRFSQSLARRPDPEEKTQEGRGQMCFIEFRLPLDGVPDAQVSGIVCDFQMDGQARKRVPTAVLSLPEGRFLIALVQEVAKRKDCHFTFQHKDTEDVYTSRLYKTLSDKGQVYKLQKPHYSSETNMFHSAGHPTDLALFGLAAQHFPGVTLDLFMTPLKEYAARCTTHDLLVHYSESVDSEVLRILREEFIRRMKGVCEAARAIEDAVGDLAHNEAFVALLHDVVRHFDTACVECADTSAEACATHRERGSRFLLDQRELFQEGQDLTHFNRQAANELSAISIRTSPPLREKEQMKEDFAKLSGTFPFLQLFMVTDASFARVTTIEFNLRSGNPLLIHGPTSSAKSTTARAACVRTFQSAPIVCALSEQTEVEDFIGRIAFASGSNSKLTFQRGVLTEAYEDGRVLILDEFDLAKPEVLSCILSALDGTEIISNQQTFHRHPNFQLICTMNGESEGFDSSKRFTLDKRILARFTIVCFGELTTEECTEICRNNLRIHALDDSLSAKISRLHTRALGATRHVPDTCVSFRNMNRMITLMKGGVPQREAATIAYVTQFPPVQQKEFRPVLRDFRVDACDNSSVKAEMRSAGLFPFPSFVQAAARALTAMRRGLHVLLSGPSGCGLTTLATWIADRVSALNACGSENNTFSILNSETTVEDLLGKFVPKIDSRAQDEDDESAPEYIVWEDGPVLNAIERGSVCVLDNLHEAKSQVTERLNPLLEANAREGATMYIQERGDNHPIRIAPSFAAIATAVETKGRIPQVSPAQLNRFVLIRVEPPEISYASVGEIAHAILSSPVFEPEIPLPASEGGTPERPSVTESDEEDQVSDSDEDLLIEISESSSGSSSIDFFDSDSPDEYGDPHESDPPSSSEKSSMASDLPPSAESSDRREGPLAFDRPLSWENSPWLNASRLSDEVIRRVCELFARNVSEFASIRDVARTAFSMKNILSLYNVPAADAYEMARMSPAAFELVSVEHIVNEIQPDDAADGQKAPFYFRNNKESDAWRSICALTIATVAHQSLFFIGPPGTGKTASSRFFSANRSFRRRSPILAISCNADSSLEHFFGSYILTELGFDFKPGPLVIAATSGVPFLADEFNLLPPSIMCSLIPVLKTQPGAVINMPFLPFSFTVQPGFVFVATGNSKSERGRSRVPSSVANCLHKIKFSEISAVTMEPTIKELFKSRFHGDSFNGVSSKDVTSLISQVKEVTGSALSYRDIIRMIRRFEEFCDVGHENDTCQQFKGNIFQKIPPAFVAISQLLPQFQLSKEKTISLIECVAETLHFNPSELVEFCKTPARILEMSGTFWVQKGPVVLKTVLGDSNFPPPFVDTLFWLRMSGDFFENSVNAESVLLVGPTSYKTMALRLWKGFRDFDERTIHREMDIGSFVGSPTLRSKQRLAEEERYFLEEILAHCASMGLRPQEADLTFNCKQLRMLIDTCLRKARGVSEESLRPMRYAMLCSENLHKLSAKTVSGSSFTNQVTSFHPGYVFKSVLFGKHLHLRGLEKAPSSIIERLNSLLETPKSFVIPEDVQHIFNDQRTLERVYGTSSEKSIPISENFSISATTSSTGFNTLSNAIKSRFTVIRVPGYNQPSLALQPEDAADNYAMIARNIFQGNKQLEEILLATFEEFNKQSVTISVSSFVRWCKTAQILAQAPSELKPADAVSVAALRSIVDSFDDKKRRKLVGRVLPMLPFDPFVEISEEDMEAWRNPIELETGRFLMIRSTLSGTRLCVQSYDPAPLEKICWTKSLMDMTDSIIVSMATGAVTIFEGSPGRGKTASALALFEAIGLEFCRINLSPSTQIEDIFGRDIAETSTKTKALEIKFQDGALTSLLRSSGTRSAADFQVSHAILLDELNLAPFAVLEILESLVLNVSRKGVFKIPNGMSVEHSPIVVVATMNSATLSGARSSLSSKLKAASHFFQLPAYTPKEISLIATHLLDLSSDLFSRDDGQKLLKAHSETQKIIARLPNASHLKDSITLREILRVIQLKRESPDIPTDLLIKIVYSSILAPSQLRQLLEAAKILDTNREPVPVICKGTLEFGKSISIPVDERFPNGPVAVAMTSKQRNVASLCCIGVKSKSPIIVSGTSGSGKTHTIRELARIAGKRLNIVQFNSATDSTHIIGRLEIGVANELLATSQTKFKEFARRSLAARSKYSNKVCQVAFANNFQLSNCIELLQRSAQLDKESFSRLARRAEKLLLSFERLVESSSKNFVFKEGPIIQSLKEGHWVLLDGVEFAPAEVERLMSLLEFEPSLTVFESSVPMVFQRHQSSEPEKATIPVTFIHPDFRIFMTCSDLSLLSPALRSRCLCLALEGIQSRQEYSELMRSCLFPSFNSEKDVAHVSDLSARTASDALPALDAERPTLKNAGFSTHSLVRICNTLAAHGMEPKAFARGVDCSIAHLAEPPSVKKVQAALASSLKNKFTGARMETGGNFKLLRILFAMLQLKILYRFLRDFPKKEPELPEMLSNVHQKLYEAPRDPGIQLLAMRKNEPAFGVFEEQSFNTLVQTLKTIQVGSLDQLRFILRETLELSAAFPSRSVPELNHAFSEIRSLLQRVERLSSARELYDLVLYNLPEEKEFLRRVLPEDRLGKTYAAFRTFRKALEHNLISFRVQRDNLIDMCLVESFDKGVREQLNRCRSRNKDTAIWPLLSAFMHPSPNVHFSNVGFLYTEDWFNGLFNALSHFPGQVVFSLTDKPPGRSDGMAYIYCDKRKLIVAINNVKETFKKRISKVDEKFKKLDISPSIPSFPVCLDITDYLDDPSHISDNFFMRQRFLPNLSPAQKLWVFTQTLSIVEFSQTISLTAQRLLIMFDDFAMSLERDAAPSSDVHLWDLFTDEVASDVLSFCTFFETLGFAERPLRKELYAKVERTVRSLLPLDEKEYPGLQHSRDLRMLFQKCKNIIQMVNEISERVGLGKVWAEEEAYVNELLREFEESKHHRELSKAEEAKRQDISKLIDVIKKLKDKPTTDNELADYVVSIAKEYLSKPASPGQKDAASRDDANEIIRILKMSIEEFKRAVYLRPIDSAANHARNRLYKDIERDPLFDLFVTYSQQIERITDMKYSDSFASCAKALLKFKGNLPKDVPLAYVEKDIKVAKSKGAKLSKGSVKLLFSIARTQFLAELLKLKVRDPKSVSIAVEGILRGHHKMGASLARHNNPPQMIHFPHFESLDIVRCVSTDVSDPTPGFLVEENYFEPDASFSQTKPPFKILRKTLQNMDLEVPDTLDSCSKIYDYVVSLGDLKRKERDIRSVCLAARIVEHNYRPRFDSSWLTCPPNGPRMRELCARSPYLVLQREKYSLELQEIERSVGPSLESYSVATRLVEILSDAELGLQRRRLQPGASLEEQMQVQWEELIKSSISTERNNSHRTAALLGSQFFADDVTQLALELRKLLQKLLKDIPSEFWRQGENWRILKETLQHLLDLALTCDDSAAAFNDILHILHIHARLLDSIHRSAALAKEANDKDNLRDLHDGARSFLWTARSLVEQATQTIDEINRIYQQNMKLYTQKVATQRLRQKDQLIKLQRDVELLMKKREKIQNKINAGTPSRRFRPVKVFERLYPLTPYHSFDDLGYITEKRKEHIRKLNIEIERNLNKCQLLSDRIERGMISEPQLLDPLTENVKDALSLFSDKLRALEIMSPQDREFLLALKDCSLWCNPKYNHQAQTIAKFLNRNNGFMLLRQYNHLHNELEDKISKYKEKSRLFDELLELISERGGGSGGSAGIRGAHFAPWLRENPIVVKNIIITLSPEKFKPLVSPAWLPPTPGDFPVPDIKAVPDINSIVSRGEKEIELIQPKVSIDLGCYVFSHCSHFDAGQYSLWNLSNSAVRVELRSRRDDVLFTPFTAQRVAENERFDIPFWIRQHAEIPDGIEAVEYKGKLHIVADDGGTCTASITASILVSPFWVHVKSSAPLTLQKGSQTNVVLKGYASTLSLSHEFPKAFPEPRISACLFSKDRNRLEKPALTINGGHIDVKFHASPDPELCAGRMSVAVGKEFIYDLDMEFVPSVFASDIVVTPLDKIANTMTTFLMDRAKFLVFNLSGKTVTAAPVSSNPEDKIDPESCELGPGKHAVFSFAKIPFGKRTVRCSDGALEVEFIRINQRTRQFTKRDRQVQLKTSLSDDEDILVVSKNFTGVRNEVFSFTKTTRTTFYTGDNVAFITARDHLIVKQPHRCVRYYSQVYEFYNVTNNRFVEKTTRNIQRSNLLMFPIKMPRRSESIFRAVSYNAGYFPNISKENLDLINTAFKQSEAAVLFALFYIFERMFKCKGLPSSQVFKELHHCGSARDLRAFLKRPTPQMEKLLSAPPRELLDSFYSSKRREFNAYMESASDRMIENSPLFFSFGPLTLAFLSVFIDSSFSLDHVHALAETICKRFLPAHRQWDTSLYASNRIHVSCSEHVLELIFLADILLSVQACLSGTEPISVPEVIDLQNRYFWRESSHRAERTLAKEFRSRAKCLPRSKAEEDLLTEFWVSSKGAASSAPPLPGLDIEAAVEGKGRAAKVSNFRTEGILEPFIRGGHELISMLSARVPMEGYACALRLSENLLMQMRIVAFALAVRTLMDRQEAVNTLYRASELIKRFHEHCIEKDFYTEAAKRGQNLFVSTWQSLSSKGFNASHMLEPGLRGDPSSFSGNLKKCEFAAPPHDDDEWNTLDRGMHVRAASRNVQKSSAFGNVSPHAQEIIGGAAPLPAGHFAQETASVLPTSRVRPKSPTLDPKFDWKKDVIADALHSSLLFMKDTPEEPSSSDREDAPEEGNWVPDARAPEGGSYSMESDYIRKLMEGNDVTDRYIIVMREIATDVRTGAVSALKRDLGITPGLDMKTKCPSPDVLALLSSISVSLQSSVSCRMKEALSPFRDPANPCNSTFRKTFVSFHVDLNGSMDDTKKHAALSLVTGMCLVLPSFGIDLNIFAFGDREAIWKLYSTDEGPLELGISRLIAALGQAGRFGSYPADSVQASLEDWTMAKGSTRTHLSIVVSDMISPQILDERFKWADQIRGSVLFVCLESLFDAERLRKHKVENIIEQRLTYTMNSERNIFQYIVFDPTRLCFHYEPTDLSRLDQLADMFVKLALSKAEHIADRTVELTEFNPAEESGGPGVDVCPSFSLPSQRILFAQRKSFEAVKLSAVPGKGAVLDSLAPLPPEAAQHIFEGDAAPRDKVVSSALVASCFGAILAPNKAGGKEPSQTHGKPWVTGILRCIISGGSYRNIFLKTSQRTKKEYALTIVLDISSVSANNVDSSHLLETVRVLFSALSQIPDSEGITVDLITSDGHEVQVVFTDIPAARLAFNARVSSIVQSKIARAAHSSTVGTALSAALGLQQQRGSTSLGQHVFVLTGGIVESANELCVLRNTIDTCELKGIEVVGIGAGLYVPHLGDLFPLSCHAVHPTQLPTALLNAFAVTYGTEEKEPKRVSLLPRIDDSQKHLLENVLGMGSDLCPPLTESIKNKSMSVDMFAAILDTTHTDAASMQRLYGDANPDSETYHDGCAEGYQILIVILYLGGRRRRDGTIVDAEITKSVFEQHTGRALRKKGFAYDLAFSYKEAVDYLRRLEVGDQCRYKELWLFSGAGDKTLSSEARDKDFSMFIPFIDHVNAFWRAGGGLCLWVDNSPIVFDVNHLLSKLQFPRETGSAPTHVRFGGNYLGKGTITASATYELKGSAVFNPRRRTVTPGGAMRFGLGAGIQRFYEGVTVAHLTDAKGRDLQPTNLWPFVPFTTSSEARTGSPRTIIAFYDPVSLPGPLSFTPGPIVLHGGFTSAFVEFAEDGTGRLVTGIACWLANLEMALFDQKIKGKLASKTLPVYFPRVEPVEFTGWVAPAAAQNLAVTFMMDLTGSMGGSIARGKAEIVNMSRDIQKECNELARKKDCAPPEMSLSFVGYRDFCDGSNQFSIVPFGKNPDAIQTHLQSCPATGGGDTAENICGGFDKTLALQWPPHTLRIVVLIADAQPHGRMFGTTSDDHPETDPSGARWEARWATVMRGLTRLGVANVFCVDVRERSILSLANYLKANWKRDAVQHIPLTSVMPGMFSDVIKGLIVKAFYSAM